MSPGVVDPSAVKDPFLAWPPSDGEEEEDDEGAKKEKLNNERLKDEMRKTEKLRNENEDLRKEKRKLQHDLAYEVEQNKYLKSHMDMLQQTASTHKQLVELYNRQLAQLKGARPDESVPIGN